MTNTADLRAAARLAQTIHSSQWFKDRKRSLGGSEQPSIAQVIALVEALASPDRILALLSERDELRAALEDFVESWGSNYEVEGRLIDCEASYKLARAALEGKPE